MEELVMAMNSRLNVSEEGFVNRNRGPLGQGGAGEVGELVIPKLAKLDFPRFDGTEDPTLWICGADQFYEFKGTGPHDQVRLAAYHLEKDAQLWYQCCKNLGHFVTWDGMEAGLLERFAVTEDVDFFSELVQVETIVKLV
uniref:Retrotransposon gag domain-containing protein n=1 Tax=Manihot esculenta TaxID=3983 RepID=A0A2C9UZU3_MANES